MAKKGATQSGGSAGRQRNKDQERCKYLPPSPDTWRRNSWDWPYHNNRGTKHNPKKKVVAVAPSPCETASR